MGQLSWSESITVPAFHIKQHRYDDAVRQARLDDPAKMMHSNFIRGYDGSPAEEFDVRVKKLDVRFDINTCPWGWSANSPEVQVEQRLQSALVRFPNLMKVEITVVAMVEGLIEIAGVMACAKAWLKSWQGEVKWHTSVKLTLKSSDRFGNRKVECVEC
jgi:hypothetical protein